jgi:peptidoglycan hydrolase-like protein with peptidoglycan-binding domain
VIPARLLRLPRGIRLAFTAGLVLVALVRSAGPAEAVGGVAWPTQSTGDRGTDVLAIQYLLRAAGLAPPLDGQFRSTTDAAVPRPLLARALREVQRNGITSKGRLATFPSGALVSSLLSSTNDGD